MKPRTPLEQRLVAFALIGAVGVAALVGLEKLAAALPPVPGTMLLLGALFTVPVLTLGAMRSANRRIEARGELPPLLVPLRLPLTELIVERVRRWQGQGPLVIGLSGAQGAGKSTLAELLARALDQSFAMRTAVLALDDFYLPRAEREQLAREVHPLLRTRGAPGTHDVADALRVLAELRAASDQRARVSVPRFDKARDDRAVGAPRVLEGRFECVIFEGWCVGATPEPEAALAQPCNALEREHDADGRYRRHVNAQLQGPYRELFEAMQLQIFLAVPDLATSLAWRIEQEQKLAARSGGPGVMSDAEVAQFAQYYERISLHMLAEMPGRADVVLRLRRDERDGAADRYASLEVR